MLISLVLAKYDSDGHFNWTLWSSVELLAESAKYTLNRNQTALYFKKKRLAGLTVKLIRAERGRSRASTRKGSPWHDGVRGGKTRHKDKILRRRYTCFCVSFSHCVTVNQRSQVKENCFLFHLYIMKPWCCLLVYSHVNSPQNPNLPLPSDISFPNTVVGWPVLWRQPWYV